MPVISMFYGLIIQMYYLDTKQHNLPHIYVSYNEFEAMFSIPNGDLPEGNLPIKKRKLIEAWIELRQEDLMTNWKLAISDTPVFKIDPLK